MSVEINTFSAAVDAVTTRAGRPDRRADVCSYIRSTLRELQMLAAFQRDLVEDTITATADPFVYVAPITFRRMDAVRYPGILDPQGGEIYPRYVPPGRAQLRRSYFWYISGDSWVFVGHGATSGSTADIDVAYLSYLPNLAYYEVAARPATYDVETATWSYLTATTASEKTAAEALVTNWLLSNWFDTAAEGGLAKLFNTNDDPRAKPTYSLYKSYQQSLRAGESLLAAGGER